MFTTRGLAQTTSWHWPEKLRSPKKVDRYKFSHLNLYKFNFVIFVCADTWNATSREGEKSLDANFNMDVDTNETCTEHVAHLK